MKKITIVLTIPKPLLSKLNSEIKMLYKKYGKYCTSSYPLDGKYRDVPHITLLTMGESYNHITKIEAKLKEIAKKHKPLKIQSKSLVIFTNGHLVVKIKNNKEIQQLHNDIVKELLPLAKKKGEFILDKYEPHSSKIINMPTAIAKKALNDAIIGEFEFIAEEIGIKVRQENTYCIIEKRIKLG
jgi:2'-5' RNA ligase